MIGAPGGALDVGVYNGRVLDGHGKSRRFRLLLFAAMPDRLHAEVLSPLGAPQLIIDGGGGRLAVTFVADSESFVGNADPDVLGRLIGAALELEDLVGALLAGHHPPGEQTMVREPPEAPGLPAAISISTAEAGLSLELRRRRPLGADPETLGVGRPPEATRVRPLEDLQDQGERIDRLTDEGSDP